MSATTTVDEPAQLSEAGAFKTNETLVPLADVRDVEMGAKPETEGPLQEHVILDGGWKAWSTVLGASLVMMCSFGYVNSFGVFQAVYVEELLSNYSTSDIAWIGSMQIFLVFGMGIPAGMLFDAHKFRTSMVVGSVLHIGCCFGLSAAQPGQYYQYFLSQGLGQGIATGLIYLTAIGVISHHFQKRRALATGIVFTGTGIGGVVFPIMLNQVFQSRGFVWGVRAAGFFLLGALLLANLLMHPHYNPAHKKAPKPSIVTLMKDKAYSIGTIGAFIAGFGLLFPFFYLQLYAISIGIDQNIAFYTIAITNGASVFGRLVPNLFADRLGPMTCQIPSLFISTALVFALYGVKDQGSLIAFCVLYGFFSGAVFSLFAPMLAFMADSMAEVGIRMGLAFFIFALAGLTGNPIIGALIGQGPVYDWNRGFAFAGVTLLVGAVLMVIARYFLQQKKQKRWV